jgi:hypothetical protein
LFKKRGEEIRQSIRGVEFDQSILHEYMEISQWNSFVQLIHTNKGRENKGTLYVKITLKKNWREEHKDSVKCKDEDVIMKTVMEFSTLKIL